MPHRSPSALITDKGQRVQLRIQGRFYELSQEELRTLLGLPVGPPGLGITIEGGRLLFEFAGDHRTRETTERQLDRLLSKQLTKKP